MHDNLAPCLPLLLRRQPPRHIVTTDGVKKWSDPFDPDPRQRRRRQWRDAAIAALLIAGIVVLVAAGEVGLFGNGGL